MSKFKKKPINSSDATVVSFNESDYVMIRLNSTGKEHVAHKLVAKKIEQNGNGKITKTQVGSKEKRGVAEVITVD